MGDGKQTVRDASGKGSRRALLFELEHVAVGGRQIKFDLLKAAFKSARVDLTEALYSRFGLHRSTKDGIAALLKSVGKTSAPSEVLERYQSGLTEAFSSTSTKADSQCEAIVKSAVAHQVRLGALTSLDAATGDALVRRLGLSELGIAVFTISQEDTRSYSGDHWLHLARRVETPPRRCIAITTQADSCRAALAARMRCIARPDRFTEFQDFSGADFIGDAISASVFEAVLKADR